MKSSYVKNEDGLLTYTYTPDKHDSWSADYLLGKLISSVLTQYKNDPEAGGWRTDIKDVPEHLLDAWKVARGGDSSADWTYCDEVCFWIIDEILFAFDTEKWDSILACDREEKERQKRGRMLFAKYFHAFWT